ncbi:MAG: tetratricopeptide repeat protein [Deltaproteobacteria bacterium]|nr:MAG: tetratricopeptide repeat protein [Deltaproteobacteria bacterium]
MRIQCPHCPAVYELDDGRVPPAGLSIKCPKCKAAFVVHRPEDGSKMARTTAAKIPLPGTPRSAAQPQKGKGNAVPLPGTPQAPARAGATAKSGAAVPLPGTQTKLKKAPAAAKAASAKPAAAKPAPSAATIPAPEDAPTEQIGDDAIPLPGIDPSSAAAAPASAAQSEIPLPQTTAEEAPLPIERSSTPEPNRDQIPLPGARRGETPAPAARGNEKPFAGSPRRSTPIPVMEPSQTPAPAPRRSPTPAPRVEQRAMPAPSHEEALPLPGLDSPLSTPAAAAKPEPARATPARQARVPTPAPSDLLPDLAAELSGPAAPLAIDLPAPQAPARRQTPAGSFKLPDEDTALTPKVAVDDTALAPKAGLDPMDFAGPQHGHIPDPSGIDFELARPTPISSSAAEARLPTPAPEARLPTPAPSNRLPTPQSSMSAESESLEVDEVPKTGRTRIPPVIAPRPPPGARPTSKWEPGQEGGAKGPSAAGALRTALRNPMFAIATVAAIAIAGVFYFGIRAGSTPRGYFWIHMLLPRAKTAAAASQAITSAEAKLGRGTFATDREALATGAQLLASAPDDDETRAFFVLCASEMKLAHGQSGADWDLAKRTVEKMKGSGPSQERARGAFALASGDAIKARQLLAPREGKDVESSWLYALALSRAGDPVRASQVLDTAIKANPTPKLLVARGRIAKQRNAPDAAQFFEKALAAAPDYGPALIELADVKLRNRDVAGASQLLSKALGTEVPNKTLDAGDEARAKMLRAKVSLAGHQADEAEKGFRNALQLDPNSAEIHAAYGAFLLSRHEWDSAHKQLEAAVTLDPANGPLLGDLATSALGLNQLLEADKRIGEAIGKDPQNAHLYYVKGRVAEAFAKLADAMKAYDEALAKKPGSVEAITAQGMLLLKGVDKAGDKAKAKEKFDTALAAKDRSLAEERAVGELALALGEGGQAKDAFTRALQMDPGDPQSHAGLGRAYAALGDLPAAKSELETALHGVTTDPVLHYEYGSLQRRLGDLPAAVESLQTAVKLDGKDARFRARLGAAYVDQGEFQKGETELRQARLSDPSSGEALFYLARALAGEGKLADAIDTMRKAVELYPDNAEYLYNQGLLYERAQQVQDAVESFRKSVARDATNPDAFEHLGQNLLIENRFGEAVKAFNTGAALDPKRARLLAEVADAQQQAGDLDGAIASFQRSLAQDPSQPGVWSKLGIAYKAKDCNGCKNKAIEALLSAEKVDAKDWVAHRELGYLYKDDGKRQQAIEHFKKYLVLRPDAPDIETVRDEVYYLQEETRRSP